MFYYQPEYLSEGVEIFSNHSCNEYSRCGHSGFVDKFLCWFVTEKKSYRCIESADNSFFLLSSQILLCYCVIRLPVFY